MADAATFLSELESKNQEQIRRLAGTFVATLSKEQFSVTDLLRIEVKLVIELVEVAALWVPDAEVVEVKMALAARAGEGARQFQQVSDRLTALGLPVAGFDPRQGGYSKLFAFFRSLQTPEERACAGFVTMGGMNLARFEAVATWCDGKGDAESAQLYRGPLTDDERRHVDEGRKLLLGVALNEESQARARRAGYKTIEFLGDAQDPALMRRFLSRSLKK